MTYILKMLDYGYSQGQVFITRIRDEPLFLPRAAVQ